MKSKFVVKTYDQKVELVGFKSNFQICSCHVDNQINFFSHKSKFNLKFSTLKLFKFFCILSDVAIFIIFLFVIGSLIDLGIYRLPPFTIEENVNKLIAALLAALKSLILIAILLFAIDSLPIQKSVKENFFLKAV